MIKRYPCQFSLRGGKRSTRRKPTTSGRAIMGTRFKSDLESYQKINEFLPIVQRGLLLFQIKICKDK